MMHDDRCPQCNSQVLGFGKPNMSEVLIAPDLPSLKTRRRCMRCQTLLVVALNIYDPLHPKETLWEECEVFA
jgi:DNA-directed RNA polymerase subunit RPC12/RpoP